MTRQDGLDDVLATNDYLASQLLTDTGAICGVGTSHGSYLVILLTAGRPVRWLAMRVPAPDLDEQWGIPTSQRDKDIVRAYQHQLPEAGADHALSACAEFHGDDGSSEQNQALHRTVMQKLAYNGGIVPDSLRN